MAKTLLEQVDGIDQLTRSLHKIESRLRMGQVIDAHREVCRIMAELERNKVALLESVPSVETANGKHNE